MNSEWLHKDLTKEDGLDTANFIARLAAAVKCAKHDSKTRFQNTNITQKHERKLFSPILEEFNWFIHIIDNADDILDNTLRIFWQRHRCCWDCRLHCQQRLWVQLRWCQCLAFWPWESFKGYMCLCNQWTHGICFHSLKSIVYEIFIQGNSFGRTSFGCHSLEDLSWQLKCSQLC